MRNQLQFFKSFLFLACAFTATDKRSLGFGKVMSRSSDLNNKRQLALYVTRLLLLNSWLFAICYFTVSYKWWVIGVLRFHSCAVVIATVIQNREEVRCGTYYVFTIILFLGIHLLLCFSYHPNAWYSLPIAVYVCVFSVLGSTMRICFLRWLSKKPAGGSPAASSGDVKHVLWNIMLVQYNQVIRLYFVYSYYWNSKSEVRFKLSRWVSKLWLSCFTSITGRA